MNIHYIAQYGENPLGRKLAYSPAGLAKMKFIIKSLQTLGFPLTVYSTSSGGNISNNFYWNKSIKHHESVTFKYCSTFGSKWLAVRMIERIFNKIQLLIYLMSYVKQTDLVVVYHEIYYLPILSLAKKVINFSLLYEVEELYTLAANMNEIRTKKEKHALQMADAYIFPNDIMANKCNFDTKPFIVSYGAYNIEPIYTDKYNDGKIHVIYAGTFDKSKGGGIAAVRVAEFLPSDYHIHIIGFGSDEEVEVIKNEIEEIKLKTQAIITFDGCLFGRDYLAFLQRCDIGLSTQDANGNFNDTSFPSKILSYLSNGLYVVSVRLEVLEKSKITNLLIYCEDNSPKALAASIKKVDISNNYDSRAFVAELDRCFENDFEKLVTNLMFIL